VIELIERARYVFAGNDPAPMGPGLVVELDRRISTADLAPCFAEVLSEPSLMRGEARGPHAVYRAFRVDGPRVDLTAKGCRIGKDPDPLPTPSLR
jgi:hypothetical protein